MRQSHRVRLTALAAAIAVVFGIATLAAGARVLLGADPGYTVFRPLLLFNTCMGVAYVAVGVLAWKRSTLCIRGAASIALLNLVVLGVMAYRYTPQGEIAGTSLQAMAFRTVVWLGLFAMLVRGRRVGGLEP